MENLQQSPIKEAKQTEQSSIQTECKTPIQDNKNDPKTLNSSKSNTPDRLQVPKAFKYPERYRSPTDLMVSPVTKGILARNRKLASLLPPSINHSKQVQDVAAQEVVFFKIEI